MLRITRCFILLINNRCIPHRRQINPLECQHFSSRGVTMETKVVLLRGVLCCAMFYQTSGTPQVAVFKLHKLNESPSKTALLLEEDAKRMYKQMYTIRMLEESLKTLYLSGKTRGPVHLCSGQEAVAVGINEVLRSQDTVIAAYRTHSWIHLMGVSNLSFMEEILGHSLGPARGKGGTMHMLYNRQFFGGNGILSAQVPVGVGIALAKRHQGLESVSVVLYGDGAANQGQIFEAFNMAKLWNLPCVFVCESNRYGRVVAVERSSADTNFYKRGDYIPGIHVDGMDVISVREATKFAFNYCISGKGPIIIEVDTYLYCSRSLLDPSATYRTKEEIDQIRETRDPISSLKEVMISNGFMSREETNECERNIEHDVRMATDMALQGEDVDVEELTADIYSNNLQTEIRNITPYNSLKHKRVGEIFEK